MRKIISHGTVDQMINAFEDKISQLEGDVHASSTIKAADDIVGHLSPEDEERYIHTLIGDTNTELEDLDILDSWTWEDAEDDLVLTTVKGSEVEEYTVPKQDLKFDWGKVEEDVQYIIKAITSEDDAPNVEDVVGATTNYDSSDYKSVIIPEYAKTEFYADSQGAFGGTENDVYSLEDIMIMWNSDHSNDPSMSIYDTFEEWWEDTKRWMKPSSAPEEGEDDEMFTDNDGIFGEPGEVISKRNMRDYYEESRDTDPSLAAFDSFEDWWAATEVMLEPIFNATDLSASTDGYVYPPGPIYEVGDISQLPDDVIINDYTIQDDVYLVELDRELTPEEMNKYSARPMKYYNNYSDPAEYCVNIENATSIRGSYDRDVFYGSGTAGFEEIASKSVPDSNGFYTDYTMYRDIETGEYVFVFGDKDVYTPDQGYFDWTCDTEEEAWSWYDNYTGLADEDNDIYSATALYQNPYDEEDEIDEEVDEDLI